ncbi:hypothetical protein P9112_012638 [Eukaryota sp. TZLM1-RC]
MSNGRPPFFGPRVENDLGLWITPRIGPYLSDERITPANTRHDPEPTHDPRPGVRFMRTTREGVFRRFAGDEDNLFINAYNPCPYPRFSPGYNAFLDILIDRDYRTGWGFTETTYGERLFLYNRRPDHIASYCGPDHRRSGNLQRALHLVAVFPGYIEYRSSRHRKHRHYHHQGQTPQDLVQSLPLLLKWSHPRRIFQCSPNRIRKFL